MLGTAQIALMAKGGVLTEYPPLRSKIWQNTPPPWTSLGGPPPLGFLARFASQKSTKIMQNSKKTETNR